MPPTNSVVALRSPKRDQGSGHGEENLLMRQASPQCNAAQPPDPSSTPGLRRGADASSAGWSGEKRPRSIYDLKHSTDGYGEEIFIQTECKTTGKPTLWYKLDRHKNRIRYERGTTGITTTRLGKTEMLC